MLTKTVIFLHYKIINMPKKYSISYKGFVQFRWVSNMKQLYSNSKHKNLLKNEKRTRIWNSFLFRDIFFIFWPKTHILKKKISKIVNCYSSNQNLKWTDSYWFKGNELTSIMGVFSTICTVSDKRVVTTLSSIF